MIWTQPSGPLCLWQCLKRKLKSVNIQKINLVGIGSVFRFFVFGFVLSCGLHLYNVRESNTKLKWKKRNMCCTVDCESFARRTFTNPKIRTFTTPKFGHFPPPKKKHLPGGQLPPPFFFLFLAHFSLLFRLTAYGGHQGWEGGGGHGAYQVEGAWQGGHGAHQVGGAWRAGHGAHQVEGGGGKGHLDGSRAS